MNENNQAISSYDYDAWGNPMNSTVSEESAYRYTGREYDDETGLHNFRARLYDSTLMRFYQVDPAEQYSTPYVYCGNNPITLTDPTGRNAEYFPVGDYVSEEDVSSSVGIIVDGFADTLIPIAASDGKLSLANPELTNANIDYLTPDQSLFYDMITNPNFTLRVGITNGLYVTCGFHDERFATNIVKADQYVSNTYNRRTKQQIATGNVHMKSMQVASDFSGEPLDQVFMHFTNECYEYSRAYPNRPWSDDKYLIIHNQILQLQTNTSAHSLKFKRILTYDNGAYLPVVRYRWYDPISGLYSEQIDAKLK
jgi:RHS repeat-associated protein